MKRADIHTEHINNPILSFLNRTISSTDLKVLKEWIDENEDNKAYFSEINNSKTGSLKKTKNKTFISHVQIGIGFFI